MIRFDPPPPVTKPTADDIRHAMRTLAVVIQKFGDDPWPIMERLQRELAAMEEREALLSSLLQDSATGSNPARFG